MNAMEAVLDYAVDTITDTSKKIKRSFSSKLKSKEYRMSTYEEEGVEAGGIFHRVDTKGDIISEKLSEDGIPDEGRFQDGSFVDGSSDDGMGNKGELQDGIFHAEYLHEFKNPASLPLHNLQYEETSEQNGLSYQLLTETDTQLKKLPDAFSNKNDFLPDLNSEVKKIPKCIDKPRMLQRKQSFRQSPNLKTRRADSIPIVRNRKFFKKKQTRLTVFYSTMSSHERRESLQRNLDILPEISNITLVSSELPIPKQEQEDIHTVEVDAVDHLEEVKVGDMKVPSEGNSKLNSYIPESESLASASVINSEKTDHNSDEKLDQALKQRPKMKNNVSLNERDLVSKSGSKENVSGKKKITQKSTKKPAMKGSMSLIDIVVASTEKRDRWGYLIPESDEEDYGVRKRRAKSVLIRSSSTSSLNNTIENGLPKSQVTDGRSNRISSFVDSETITSTDLDEEYGEDWNKTGLSVSSNNGKHALKTLSRSTPAMSPSGSPRHSDSEVPARLSRINKVFRKKFSSVTTNEKVINYYACAIVSDILLQGTLYITENYFAFYSNIFGYVNRTVLPIAEVASIQKEKTAKFIPNAVGVQMFDGKTYVFSSLISRDATYKFMIHTWRKSRKLTDSDSEPPFIIPGPKEEDEESEPNSVDSNCDEDSIDNGIVEGSSVSSHNDAVWSQSSPVILSNSFESSAANSGHATPVQESLPSVASLVSAETDKSTSKKPSKDKDSESTTSSSSNQWIVHTKIINSVLHVGVVPFQLVKEGLHEITFLPKTSVLLILSSALVFLLLASAAFMIYRVEVLSQHINFSPPDEFTSNLYEEVLKMQQKLHSATAEEVEKTLSLQIKQLATVRQSLDALTFLFNKEPSQPSPQIQENT